MMQGIHDLFDSERGVFCVLLVVIAAAFVIVGKMTVDQWINFVQVIGVALVGSKTVTGVAETIAAGKQPGQPSASSQTPKSPF